MNTQLCKEVLNGSINGEINFAIVVQKLIADGFESYHVDLVRDEYRYYMPNGESHVETLENKIFQNLHIKQDFCAKSVVAAIRQAQNSEIKYIEFMQKIADAGCNYYIVYLNGKKVIYFGRNGDFHIEYFPNK